MATPAGGDAVVAVPRDAIDVLLDDAEWLDAEFMAVMRTAGIGDREIRLSSQPQQQQEERPDEGPARPAAAERRHTTGSEARTRSPPGR